MIFVVTLPSGPVQLLKASFVAVPTCSGELPFLVPFGMLPDACDPGVLPLAVQVTSTPRLLSTVLAVLAVYEPPPLTLAVSLVALAAAGVARAGAAAMPITAAAPADASRIALTLFEMVMESASLSRF